MDFAGQILSSEMSSEMRIGVPLKDTKWQEILYVDKFLFEWTGPCPFKSTCFVLGYVSDVS